MKNRNLGIAAGVLLLVFIALRFVALEADFPLGISKSSDLYTDEGAYTSAALNYHLRGAWISEGDANPAVSMPVTQVLQALSFSMFGPGLGVARCTVAVCFVLIIFLSMYLVRKHAGGRAALLVGLLLSTNYYLFAYSRFANNEMPMTLFLLVSVIVSLHFPASLQGIKGVVAGAAFVTAVLAKTTALFGLPLLVLALWHTGVSPRTRLREVGVFLGTFLGLMALYYGWANHALGDDLRQYLSVNHSKRVSLNPFAYIKNISRTLGKPIVTDPLLYPIVFLGTAYAAVKSGVLRGNAVFFAGALWGAGYLLLVNSSDYQPSRYAVPYAVAQAWLAGLLAIHVLRGGSPGRRATVAIVLTLVIAANVVRVGLYLATPDYSLLNMAKDIREQMDETGVADPVLMGTAAATVGLAGDVRNVGSEYGTRDLHWRLDTYRPTHFLTLGNDATEKEFPALGITLEKAAEYRVYENYATKKPMTLYRLRYPAE